MQQTLVVRMLLILSISYVTKGTTLKEVFQSTQNFFKFIDEMTSYTSSALAVLISDDSADYNFIKDSWKFGFIWKFYLNKQSEDEIVRFLSEVDNKPILVYLKCENNSLIKGILKNINDVDSLININWILLSSDTTHLYFEHKHNISIKILVTNLRKKNGSSEIGIHYVHHDFERNGIVEKFLGFWNKEKGLKTNKLFKYCCYDLKGYAMKIIGLEGNVDLPYTHFEKIGNTWKMVGAISEPFLLLADHLGLKISEIKLFKDEQDQKIDAINAGLLALKTGEYDLFLKAFVDTEEVRLFGDTTYGIIKDNPSLVYEERNFEKFWTFYIEPYDTHLWIVIGVTITIILATAWLFDYFNNGIHLNMNTMNILAEILNQGMVMEEYTIAWRTLHLSCIVFGGMITAIYSSTIVERHAVRVPKQSLTSLRDLAHTEQFFPLVYKDGHFHRFFKYTEDEDYKILYQRIMELDGQGLTLTDDITKNIKGTKFAYFATERFIFHQLGAHSPFSVVGSNNGNHPVWLTFLLKKNSSLVHIFNKHILTLTRAGILKHSDRKYENYLRLNILRKSTDPSVINLFNVYFPIYILIAGIFVTIFTLLFEKIVKYKTH